MAPNPLATASGILRAGRALLVEKGWGAGSAQPQLENDTEYWWGNCAHEAIAGIGGKRACAVAIRHLSLVVAPNGRGTSIEIVGWNDAPGRTSAQVLAAYDKAIATAEKEEANGT
jgi:hypothetical protein